MAWEPVFVTVTRTRGSVIDACCCSSSFFFPSSCSSPPVVAIVFGGFRGRGGAGNSLIVRVGGMGKDSTTLKFMCEWPAATIFSAARGGRVSSVVALVMPSSDAEPQAHHWMLRSLTASRRR